jgi:hypothetical protein
VEYLPVEWHNKFREKAGEGEDMDHAGHLRLRDITLKRIPHLRSVHIMSPLPLLCLTGDPCLGRSFVNDALLDVLYFMSPAYHQVRPRA